MCAPSLDALVQARENLFMTKAKMPSVHVAAWGFLCPVHWPCSSVEERPFPTPEWMQGQVAGSNPALVDYVFAHPEWERDAGAGTP